MPTNKIIFLLLLMFTMVSCITFKRSSTKGSNTYYETFYINDTTLQYFIKPIEFQNSSKFIADFTFRKSKQNISDITMNFSCVGKQKMEIDTVYLISDNRTYSIPINKLLFKELQKNIYTYRYGTTITFNNFNDIFSSVNPKIQVNDNIYLPTKKTYKNINKIKIYLLDFELKE